MPVFRGGGFLGGVTLVPMPDYLYVVEHDFGLDRLRRIPYAEIREIMCGRVWSWTLPLLFLGVAAAGLIALSSRSQIGPVLLGIAGVLLVVIVATGGKTVFIVETRFKTVKVAATLLGRGRAAAFSDAVLGYVERDQGEAPERLGQRAAAKWSSRTRASEPGPERDLDVVEAEAVEVETDS